MLPLLAKVIYILFVFLDFFASGCWVSSSVLHYGLGHQHFAAPKAKTGLSTLLFLTFLSKLKPNIP